MTAVLIGSTGCVMLAVGLEIPWLASGFVRGVWDLAAIVSMIVSVSLLEGL